MTPTNTTRIYNQIADEYAARWNDTSVLNEQMTQFVAHLSPRSRVLDLGCGPGRDLQALQQHGVCVVGLDLSAGMLRHAAQRQVGSLLMADFRTLPFGPNRFDGVWASASLLHLPKADLPVALRHLARVVRGVAYLSFKAGYGAGVQADGRFFALYQPQAVTTCLQAAGWQAITLTQNQDSRGHNWLNIFCTTLQN